MSSNGHFSDHAKSNSDSSLAVEIPRKSGAPTNKAQRSNNGNPSMKSFLGAAALQSSKSKPREELPTIRSSGNSSTNPSSRNPRRNPPTKILEQARSNGGRPRTLNVRGLSSEFQSSSTRTVAPTKKSTTRKKIVWIPCPVFVVSLECQSFFFFVCEILVAVDRKEMFCLSFALWFTHSVVVTRSDWLNFGVLRLSIKFFT